MFKYLFYRIFRFQNKVFGEEKSTAANSAFLSVALFYNINFFSIFIILDKSIDLLAFFDELLFKSNIIVPGIVLLITGLVSYFQFYYNLKYNNIIDEIENTDYKIRRKYNLWAIVYQIVSLIIIIGAIVFRFS
jgi:hypothetical protein